MQSNFNFDQFCSEIFEKIMMYDLFPFIHGCVLLQQLNVKLNVICQFYHLYKMIDVNVIKNNLISGELAASFMLDFNKQAFQVLFMRMDIVYTKNCPLWNHIAQCQTLS